MAVELSRSPGRSAHCGFCLLAALGGNGDRVQACGPEGLWRVVEPGPFPKEKL